MNADMQSLVYLYLDDNLSDEQGAQLNSWVKQSPANAAAFAQAVLLHDRLRDVVRADRALQPQGGDGRRVVGRGPQRAWRRLGVVGALAACLAVTFVAIWWNLAPSISAAAELDRLIESSSQTADRSYVIHNLDAQREPVDSNRPPIDGAALYVRQPDQYVLVRHYPDGRELVTGSDGERSWSISADGNARVSSDPMRFRGPVPGNQYGIPFVNLRSDLVQLRDAYVVNVLPADASGNRGLRAQKKSPEYRGPRSIELWYDPKTGVIRRMIFTGMPRARGGPDSLSVDLLEQRDLGRDFFHHQSHHPAGSRVIEED